ncbi:hypothetical protein RIF29_24632 [Crotalaria pallida]|uniref:Replication factor A C-terminal domain-containing protein n=1 Tax=Crotalaria pallida TaxID=3830 RepID=A0AAN9ESD5_CROPI
MGFVELTDPVIASKGLDVDAKCESFITKAQSSVEDEFLKLYPKKSIADIIDYPEDGSVILLATVSEIVNNGNWWYPACKCHKAVFPDNGVYYCSSCNRHVFNVTPRYKVTIDVSDDSGSAWLILFDYDIQYLIGKPGVDSDAYPVDFNALLGRRMLFKVSNTSSTTYTDTPVFKVTGLCDDPSVIIAMYQLPGAESEATNAIPVMSAASVVDLSNYGNDMYDDADRFASSLIVTPFRHESNATNGLDSAESIDAFNTPLLTKRKYENAFGESSSSTAPGRKRASKYLK